VREIGSVTIPTIAAETLMQMRVRRIVCTRSYDLSYVPATCNDEVIGADAIPLPLRKTRPSSIEISSLTDVDDCGATVEATRFPTSRSSEILWLRLMANKFHLRRRYVVNLSGKNESEKLGSSSIIG